ncbi:Aspartic proteinase yapsin-3 [Cytospora mali]|uniref:Aspartic proteinase yapsin-3 n=1 Tax=Cytospora mali TaxID=578113 RepID=A0A194VPD0_CYTMA|nr:Aspartic proteinase yapsin-3 [Valsa mali]
MLSQLLSASAVIAVSAAAPAPASPSGYVAIPLSWEYGSLPKITTDIVWGTPGQNSSVPTVFDTGSSAFWVAGPDNLAFYGTPYKGERGPCNETLTPYYDWKLSQTHTPAVSDVQTFAYGGNAHVVYSYYTMNDTISFPQTGYPKIPNRNVAVSNETLLATGRSTVCTGYSTDISIMGMDPDSNFRSDLLGEGIISSNTLSIWFDKAPEDAKGTFTGTALLGALPPSSKYTGKLTKVDSDWSSGSYYIATPTFKTKSLNSSASASTTTIPLENPVTTCLVDTGSPNLELPISLDITNITGLTTAPYTDILAYNGSCDSIPATATLDFEWDNVTISLPYRNLIRGYLDGIEPGYCVLSVFAQESSCVFGSPFFSAAVIAFDDTAEEVYLAQGGVSTGAADGTLGLGDVVPLLKGQ